METEHDAILGRVAIVMRRTFRLSESVEIDRRTTSTDIAGWDSLSHALLIMGIEKEFDLTLPFDKMYDLANVGELVDLIRSIPAQQL
jgi:acyl carrier protein